MEMSEFEICVPHVRPHIHRREGQIYFMISRRPFLDLSANEIPLFDSIDGRRTVAQLKEVSREAAGILRRWRESSIIELVQPVSSPSSPHLVVVEPHMDDAALSVGGRILHRRGTCRITVLSVVRWSNFTSYLVSGREFVNVNEISRMRGQESALAALLFGAEHCNLDWLDAPLRLWPAEQWSSATVKQFSRAPQLFTNLLPDPEDVTLLADNLLERLEILKPDELWIPMGLGNHRDHRTTRSACLMMLDRFRDRFGGVRVSMYEDLPYAAAPGHSDRILGLLSTCGTRTARITEDISDVFEEKMRVISVYASQFKRASIEPSIRALGEREAGVEGRLGETSHELDGIPRLPPESQLAREAKGLAALEIGLRALLRNKPRRIAVIALTSGHLGKWQTDSEFLAATFQNTKFAVQAPRELAWQAERGGACRLTVEFVGSGWRGVLYAIYREFLRFRTPTIVLWRGAYGAPPMAGIKRLANFVIRCLLPFRRVILARTLWDVCRTAEQITRESTTVSTGTAADIREHLQPCFKTQQRLVKGCGCERRRPDCGNRVP